MLRAFSHNELELQTIVKGDELFFKGKDVCDALGYERPRDAIRTHVSDKYKIKLSEIKGAVNRSPLANEQPHAVFVTEPGLYELIFSSKLPAAVEFREWVFEEVLPTLRKTGSYSIFNGKNPLVFKIENEDDLHNKVVHFIRRFYPEVIHIAGLGELQDTSSKRIKSWKKGYMKGQPDLIIANPHKHYSGFCIEFKTPKGTGVTSEAQRKLLEMYKRNGYKILISNDYDEIVLAMVDYCSAIRIPCPYCCKKFVQEVTLKSHLQGFHKISPMEV